MDEEARLLGYPPCCVRDHYRRDALMRITFYRMLERASGGDLDEIKRLLREDVQLVAETSEEIDGLAEAREFRPAPFTSFNMCPDCAAQDASPARLLSGRYEALAQAVDRQLAAEIAANAPDVA